MAFYEMLPGAGMPPGLQAGMDSVLNKKFGTSTTYPAEGWPDTVNLLGPLPEKTASGAIVTFPDGADGVPLKKCEITLPASLDGYTEIDVVATGKNVFDMDKINQISYYANLVNSYWYTDPIFLPKNTTLTISPSSAAALGVSDYFVMYINPDPTDPDYLVITNPDIKYVVSAGTPQTVTFTTGATGVIRFGIASYAAQPKQTAFDAFLSIDYQIEAGNTASAFEPYNATTHTAQLGRTIYGGQADVVNGEGEAEYPNIDMGSLNWGQTLLNGVQAFYVLLDNAVLPPNNSTNGDFLAEDYTVKTANQVYSGTSESKIISLNTGGYLQVRDSDYSSASDFKTAVTGKKLVFKTTTPETFTFDSVPIDSKLGNNTLWSEQGSDTEVTYRADINLALGGN